MEPIISNSHNPVEVTIVTVVYNSESLIEKTILSVINQTFSNFEYILIDGNSSDNTFTIAKQYAKHISVLVSEPDKGIYDAMNKAISLASGQWICFMNSGDCFHGNDVLKNIFEEKTYGNSVGVLYGDTHLCNGNMFVGQFKNTPFWETRFPFKTGKGICHQSMFTRTNLAKRLKFNLCYKISADFDMAYKIYELHYSFQYVPLVVSDFDINGISSLGGRWQDTYREMGDILHCKNRLSYKSYFIYKWIKVKAKEIIHFFRAYKRVERK